MQSSRIPQNISPCGALAERKQSQTMYILEAIAATRLRDILSLNLCMNPSTIPPKNFPRGAFDETIQTKRNIYNLDASPNVRPRWKNVASPPKKGNSYMCTSVQKKGIMFRMVARPIF